MNKIYSTIVCVLLIATTYPISGMDIPKPVLYDEHLGIVWSETYGGTSYDYAMSVQSTSDEGYIIAGYTKSFGAGDWDAWLIKTDSVGQEQWNRTFGGPYEDIAHEVIETSDGGYILVGYDGYNTYGNYELWILKTDANGTIEWSNTFQKGTRVFGMSIIETDSGYVAVASADSDIWLIELNDQGTMMWNTTFGGANADTASSVIQDSSGGYVIVGTTYTYSVGSSDLWVIKTNEMGIELWNKSYGGWDYDTGGDLIQTIDGGYAITGRITPVYGGWGDVCLIKIDKSGNESWRQLYGGDDLDYGKSLIQTNDSAYLIAGITHSYGSTGFNGWVIKTDVYGNELWNLPLGGPDDDHANAIIPSIDGGYIIAGKYRSKTGHDDAWLVKIDHTPTVSITKPTSGLYFLNRFIRPYLFRNPLIIGPITIEVSANDSEYPLNRVEFFIDDDFQADATTEPYSWTWNMLSFSRHTLKVVAVNTNNISAHDEITIWKLF